MKRDSYKKTDSYASYNSKSEKIASKNRSNFNKTREASVDTQGVTKKISFSSVGRFDVKGNFYFTDEKEIKRIHGYYKILSDQRYKYASNAPGSSKNQRSTSRGTSSKTRIVYKPFTSMDNSDSYNFRKNLYKTDFTSKISRHALSPEKVRPKVKPIYLNSFYS